MRGPVGGGPVTTTRERTLRAAIEIERAIGESRVLTDADLLVPYGSDDSEAPARVPDAVVRATSADDVVHVLAAAQKHGVPVTPRGAGTGRTGGAIPVDGGIVLATDRKAQIHEIDRANLFAVVDPGVVTGSLQEAVEAQGLFYPPDPNSLDSCALGGNVAENAGGPRAFKYGVTREYVLGLEVVLMGGTRLRTGRRTVKGVTGYDVTALLVGSEGTLGVFTELWLRLVPQPAAVATALVIFPDVRTAGEGVAAIVAAGVVPRVLELMDDVCLAVVRAKGGVGIPESAGSILLVEVDGPADRLEAEMERVADACTRVGARDVLVTQSAAESRRLWAARRVLSHSLRDSRAHKIAEDIVVRRSRIPEMLAAARAIGEKHRLDVATYGHAGDGNLHTNFLWDDPDAGPRVEAAVRELFQVTLDLGGTLSGEHGIGILKAPFLPMEQSPELIDLQTRIKAAFDPKGLMNPGKIFPRSGHGAC